MKRFLIGAAIVGGLIAGSVAVAAPAHGNHDAIEDHCPNHNGNPAKDESGSDDNNLVPVSGTRICVKAGNENSDGGATGIIVADGVKTLRQYLAAAGIVDGGGELGRNVSYWVTYPPLLEAFICFEGQIVVLTNEVQAALNLAVTAYLELHPGAIQVNSREATCVVTTTTTVPVVTTTTTAPVITTTTTAPVVTPTTQAPVAPAPVPVASPGPVAEAPHDVCIVNGASVKVAPGTCPPGTLPRTGSNSWLLWVGLGLLVSGLASWGMGTMLRRQAAGNLDENITL